MQKSHENRLIHCLVHSPRETIPCKRCIKFHLFLADGYIHLHAENSNTLVLVLNTSNTLLVKKWSNVYKNIGEFIKSSWRLVLNASCVLTVVFQNVFYKYSLYIYSRVVLETPTLLFLRWTSICRKKIFFFLSLID